MIIIRLWGGLGNQLFQYAYGYSQARKNQTELVLDTRFFSEEYLKMNPRFSKQDALIFQLPINYRNMNIPEEMNFAISLYQRKNINRIMRIPSKIMLPLPQNYRYIKETRMRFDDYWADTHGDRIYYDGYWQCEKYFCEYRNELLHQFNVERVGYTYQRLLEKIQEENSIAVHIRRGDYVNGKKNPGNLNPLPLEYYYNAISRIERIVENPQYYVFSNDIEWVKKNFLMKKKVAYISGLPGLDTLDEFFLMSKCKNMIIANSTYSWWAAWLNQNKEKKIFTPSMWFGNQDIYPEEWFRV